jgi:hypothetical protein
MAPFKYLSSMLPGPKTLFIIPNEKLSTLTITLKPPELVKLYEKISEGARNHFSGDMIELKDLNEKLQKRDYLASKEDCYFLGRRFNWMEKEISAYSKFRRYASPLVEKSPKLLESLEIANILVDSMKMDIRSAEMFLNRRVY